MHNEVFVWAGSEQQVKVLSGETQRLAAGFGQEDVVTGRYGATDPEHRTLQALILPINNTVQHDKYMDIKTEC